MFRLPVSGLAVVLRQPTGLEDILLLEAPRCDTHLALTLVSRLASCTDGSVTEWGALPVTDLDVLLLRLRQRVFGDVIRTDVRCPVRDCGARIDVMFRIEDYLAHHTPHRPRGVDVVETEPGWFQWRDKEIRFRLPSGADQAAVAGLAQPERELIRRCIRPAELPARWLRRVENAMDALAPSLSHLQGDCLECRTRVDIHFDVQPFVLRELRDQAVFLYQDVHLLARYYHWPEEKIMELPRYRRIHYAEMLAQERRPY
jgi:hypothetical protein